MGSAWVRLCRAFTLLSLAAGLGACVPPQNPYAPGGPSVYGGSAPLPTPSGRRVAILAPMTGSSADVGASLLRGAQLAADQPGGPPLDSKDTGGTPVGAANAARDALASGAGVIVGPLTANETAAVAPVARAAGVPVLAFTSDQAQAQPGVWPMGITAAQQVRTLVSALRAENKARLAAILPSNAFGDALADGLAEATAAFGMPPAQIVRYGGTGLAGLETALKEVAGPDQAAPPPLDALLLGTPLDLTAQAIPLLSQNGLAPDRVRILGTALWARDSARLAGLNGAWYAAPDPAMRAAFERLYVARYGAPPRDFASIAFDAAAAARAMATPNGFNPNILTRPEGFAGADGVFVLLPDGRVRRGLALFEIGPNGARVRQPGPRSLTAPGV